MYLYKNRLSTYLVVCEQNNCVYCIMYQCNSQVLTWKFTKYSKNGTLTILKNKLVDVKHN